MKKKVTAAEAPQPAPPQPVGHARMAFGAKRLPPKPKELDIPPGAKLVYEEVINELGVRVSTMLWKLPPAEKQHSEGLVAERPQEVPIEKARSSKPHKRSKRSKKSGKKQ